MKDIKEILNNYSEQPSEEVWNRLSARLDEEMPVTKRTASTWKWAAPIISSLVIGGIAFLVWTMYNVGDRPKERRTNAQQTEQAVTVHEETTVVEKDVAPLLTDIPSTETVAKTPESNSPKEVSTPKTQQDVTAQESRETTVKNTSKPNVRQEVIPANSTLAKQLAEDPILKTISPEDVDWTMPIHLSIPNLFTPNNDGVNDFFVIEGIENYTSPKLIIRDKNGRVVYQSNHYTNTWGGENCPDGVYSYEFNFSYNGIENQATGKVRIIRN